MGGRYDNINALLGAYTADGGADDEDTIMAHLDLIKTAVDSVLQDTAVINTSVEYCVEKSDGSCPNGDDPIFTITGGPILLKKIVGIVTDTIGANASNCTLEIDTTAPAATVAMSTAVAVQDDAIGTSYTLTAASPGVFTPTTAGTLDQVPTNDILIPIGGIVAKFSAANTGAIKWYLVYKPLSPNSVVVAAS